MSSFQLIKFDSVSKAFGPKVILSAVSFTLSQGDRVALIGENGVGKTTLAKLILKKESQDTGKIETALNCLFGYLPQELDHIDWNISLKTLFQEFQGTLATISLRLRALEDQMAKESDEILLKKAMDEWDRLHTFFVSNGGYLRKKYLEECLNVLKLDHIDPERQLLTLSGGERRRALLAAILLQHPDMLILDEPTNHLDDFALNWLCDYLSFFKGAALIISHDRYFLNKVANKVFELSQTKHSLKSYTGNYDSYLEAKLNEIKIQQALFEKQKEEVFTLEKFLKEQTFSSKKRPPPKDNNIMAYDKHGEKFTKAKRTKINSAKNKLEALEKNKLENIQPKGYRGLYFRYTPALVNQALIVEDVEIMMEDKTLFRNLSFDLKIGERLVIQGPNGCGKTTLLRYVKENLTPKKGRIIYGAGTVFRYLPQDAILEKPLTLIAYLQNKLNLSEQEIRGYLHRMALIEEQFIGQRIETLSMGQKRRLQLLELMSQNSNVLLLDEPTNHLAPFLIEKLEEALVNFPGAVIVATHDKRFTEKVGTRFLSLKEVT